MKTCKICANEIPDVNGIYCSMTCYKTDKTNVVKKRMVWVDGNLVSSTEAMRILNTNLFTLARMILDEANTRVQPHPSREEYIQESLDGIYKRFPSAPTRDDIVRAKAERLPLKTLAKRHGISQTQISTLCLLHGIDTSFVQVEPEIHEKLEDIHQLFKEHGSAEQIASLLGVSPSLVLQKAHAAGVIITPSFTSRGETEIRTFVESLGFTTTKRKTGGYEIDIFIPEKQLGIEFNGVYWHSQFSSTYHRDKYRKAKAEGIRLLQIWDLQWYEKPDVIRSKIRHALGIRETSVWARNLTVSGGTMDDVREFYETYHLQGAKPATAHFVLKDKETIVAALSVAVKGNTGKMERYASSVSVAGGFERLFKAAQTSFPNLTWVTFVDLMWSDEDNNQYTRSGFMKTHCSRPNYFWVKGKKMHSRMNFQKHKLKHLPTYDPNKSEAAIMEAAGYYRVYDCGHAVLKM